MKERTRQQADAGQEFGDCYAYIAMERTSKLVLTYQSTSGPATPLGSSSTTSTTPGDHDDRREAFSGSGRQLDKQS